MINAHIKEGILSAIGRTPLIPLRKIFEGSRFRLFAKLEGLNPGGSMKDRAAASMIRRAIAEGNITPETIVIESSSGNMGIGLAQICAYLKLRFICVIDPKTSMQNVRLLESYGAEVDRITQPDPVTGEYLKARLNRVKHLASSLRNSFWPNQYRNTANSAAHHETMREIADALGSRIDLLFCATSTCGTLRGCAEYVRNRGLTTKITAVDAVGSVIFGGRPCKRLIPGHGASIRPELFENDLAQECIHVSDLDCVVGCRCLAKQEGILAGGSSGGLIAAIAKAKPLIPRGAVCVAILPDRGERYLDTIYSDLWVQRHFGEVSYLWTQGSLAQPHGQPTITTIVRSMQRTEALSENNRNGR